MVSEVRELMIPEQSEDVLGELSRFKRMVHWVKFAPMRRKQRELDYGLLDLTVRL